MAATFGKTHQSNPNATDQKRSALKMQQGSERASGAAHPVVAAQQKSSIPNGRPRYIYCSASARDGKKKSEITLHVSQRMNIPAGLECEAAC